MGDRGLLEDGVAAAKAAAAHGRTAVAGAGAAAAAAAGAAASSALVQNGVATALVAGNAAAENLAGVAGKAGEIVAEQAAGARKYAQGKVLSVSEQVSHYMHRLRAPRRVTADTSPRGARARAGGPHCHRQNRRAQGL